MSASPPPKRRKTMRKDVPTMTVNDLLMNLNTSIKNKFLAHRKPKKATIKDSTSSICTSSSNKSFSSSHSHSDKSLISIGKKSDSVDSETRWKEVEKRMKCQEKKQRNMANTSSKPSPVRKQTQIKKMQTINIGLLNKRNMLKKKTTSIYQLKK